jgi:hypothetical protein
MENRIAQFIMFVNRIDRRYLQAAYALFLLGLVILGAPDDGGSGGH